jgi:hypothetical protein
MPDGTSAQRPASPVAGAMRYNTTENVMEYYNGTNWYFVSPKVVFLKDVKADGIYAGSSISLTWQTRDLNTIEGDASAIISLVSNQFTLSAGEYVIHAKAPGFVSLENKVRLQNISTASTIALGSNYYFQNGFDAGYGFAEVETKFTLGSNSIIQLQHYMNNGVAVNGLGTIDTIAGTSEIYSIVKIEKLR